MSGNIRIEYSLALTEAVALLECLAPACEKASLAGSIRRQAHTAGDIELVLSPILGRNLFNEPLIGCYPALDDRIAYLIQLGRLEYDIDVKRDGPKYKRFISPGLSIPVEVFIAEPGNYGNILAIRTGDSNFSKALVTAVNWGGLMPGKYQQYDGYLIERDTKKRIECHEEGDFFKALGITWPEPPIRGGALAAMINKQLKEREAT
jgi:DNA polymerase/3'-5' exonuclease PolX